LNEGHNIPREAIQGGGENGHPLYICRAYFEGGVHVGKASPNFAKGALIGWGGQEIEMGTYEILIGDSRAIRWLDVHGGFAPEHVQQYRPVEGGHEIDGRPIFVGQGLIDGGRGGTHPGKIQLGGSGVLIPYGGEERELHDYKILCYC